MSRSYFNYGQAAAWNTRTRQMLATVGYQCTGRVWHAQHGEARCPNTQRLRVYPRTDTRPGQERGADLQGLYRRCHLCVAVQVPDCETCGSPVLEPEALEEFVTALVGQDPECNAQSVQDALTYLEDYPDCSYCGALWARERSR